jgi:hypothetical protein
MPAKTPHRSKPPPPGNADNPEQSRRFIDMAREVEADETPGATDRSFDRVIKKRTPSCAKSRDLDESER